MIIAELFENEFIQSIISSRIFIVWKSVAISIGIFILILFLKNIFTKYIIKGLNEIFKKMRIKSAAVILNSFEGSIRASFVVIGIYIVATMIIRALELNIRYSNINIIVNKILGSIIIILITRGLVTLVSNSNEFITYTSDKYNINMNTVLMPTIGKLIKFLIVAFCVIQVANIWGIDINAFITGIGLSGVVVALAAKDFAANMMSGAIIFMDSPFTIGDWIKCNDLEGIVEEISFRSTRIRTFDKVLISVPNSVLANEPIFNYNKRHLRRVTMNIGVTYDTPREKIEECSREIRNMLMKSPGVDNEGIVVNFDKFNDSSLDIALYFFINEVSFDKYMITKEQVNYEIMRIIEKLNIEIAFPSQTVYIRNEKESTPI